MPARSPVAAPPCPFAFTSNREQAAVRYTVWRTPGRGVSVGVQVPCRRFIFTQRTIHEDNYESKG
jgi:hypothetical protein